MDNELVDYLGRKVPKQGFRVFVYNRQDNEKLVESWEEFEKAVSSGIWFATKESIPYRLVKVPNSQEKNQHKGGK